MGHRVWLITCITAGLIALGAVPAHAVDYRYWMYWTAGDQGWEYSQRGPASVAVNDGDVHGWRFGISADDGSTAAEPARDPKTAFDEVCGGTAAPAGEVRIAMVIDPGDAKIAPAGDEPGVVAGRCAVVPAGSTGATALSAVAELRLEDGFVCGIDGYPARECTAAVEEMAAAPATEPTAEPTESNPMPFLIAGGVVACGLVAAWLMSRRRT